MISVELIKMRIQEAIKRSNLTQTQIARQLAVSQSCIAHYSKGDIVPAIDTFANLCILLDEDPAYLLGLVDEAGNKFSFLTENLDKQKKPC